MNERQRVYNKKYREENREKVRAWNRKSYRNNKEKQYTHQKAYRLKHKEKFLAYSSKYGIKARAKWKNKVFDILGHKCVRCGFSDKRALQFDHIAGYGKKTDKGKTTYARYRWYALHPEETKKIIQVLCANCNWIKRYENKEFSYKVGGKYS